MINEEDNIYKITYVFYIKIYKDTKHQYRERHYVYIYMCMYKRKIKIEYTHIFIIY